MKPSLKIIFLLSAIAFFGIGLSAGFGACDAPPRSAQEKIHDGERLLLNQKMAQQGNAYPTLNYFFHYKSGALKKALGNPDLFWDFLLSPL